MDDTETKKPKRTARGLARADQVKDDDGQGTDCQTAADVYSSRGSVFRQQRQEMTGEWMKFLKADRSALPVDRTKAEKNEVEMTDAAHSVVIVEGPDDKQFVPRSPSPPRSPMKTKQRRNSKTEAILRNVEAITDCHLKQKDTDDSYRFEPLDGYNDDDGVVLVNDEWNLFRKINVKISVLERGNLLRYDMQMKDEFGDVMRELARQFDVDPKRGMLMFGDKTVRPTDTPASIGLTISDVLDFGVLPAHCSDLAPSVACADSTESDRNVFRLKLQSANARCKVELLANKNEPISKLMDEYAAKCGTDVARLVFKFDGDVLDEDSTPDELGLEDGFCIDVSER